MPFPPLLLIHGPATSAWIWDVWRKFLGALGWNANVLDLRGHGRSLPVEFSTVTMEDYVADVESVTRQIAASFSHHPVLFGWDMGGLVAMMYASGHPETPALVLFSPRPPFQVGGRASAEEVRQTPIESYSAAIYGVRPDDPQALRSLLFDLTDDEMARVIANCASQLESGFARRQRQRGISIPQGSLHCPSLVVYGERDAHFSPELNRRLAIFLAADKLEVGNAGHWGIICGESLVAQTAPKVDVWLRDVLGG